MEEKAHAKKESPSFIGLLSADKEGDGEYSVSRKMRVQSENDLENKEGYESPTKVRFAANDLIIDGSEQQYGHSAN